MLGWKTLIQWGEDFLREWCCGWLRMLIQGGLSQRLLHLGRLSAGLFMFSQTFFLQACYPSLVDEQDTPRGKVLLQTGHLSSLTIHQFPFKQLVNKGVYSFKLNHWKAAQTTVELVNQFAIQSHGLIALLVNQAKKQKSARHYESKSNLIPNNWAFARLRVKAKCPAGSGQSCHQKTCSMIVLWEYRFGTGEMVHSGLFSSH